MSRVSFGAQPPARGWLPPSALDGALLSSVFILCHLLLKLFSQGFVSLSCKRLLGIFLGLFAQKHHKFLICVYLHKLDVCLTSQFKLLAKGMFAFSCLSRAIKGAWVQLQMPSWASGPYPRSLAVVCRAVASMR